MKRLNRESRAKIRQIIQIFSKIPNSIISQGEMPDNDRMLAYFDLKHKEQINGGFINRFMFAPNEEGDIVYIYIWGKGIEQHQVSLLNQMTFCGIPLYKVTLEEGIIDPYLIAYVET